MKILLIFLSLLLGGEILLAFNGKAKVSIKEKKVIKDYAKSLDWSHQNNKILSAAKGRDGYYDVFVIDPDGMNEKNLTANSAGCPQRHNGNPCWHPSGKFVIFTAQNEDAKSAALKKPGRPGTGYNCNLYLMTANGGKFWQLTDHQTREFNPLAVIHPQFSPDGKKLLWAERLARARGSAWGEWALKLADFSFKNSRPCLANITTYQPGGQDFFYESHHFSKDGGKILFSGNLLKGQPENGMDIYEMDLTTRCVKRLTHTFNDWDEHAHYSPDNKKISWMSSAGIDINWVSIVGDSWRKYIATDLWIMNRDGSGKQRLTHFNEPGHPEYLNGARIIVSDSTWSPDGKQLAVTVAYIAGKAKGAKIVLVSLE
ncbi:TolB family protein [Planctomycetota bacterium]